MSRNLIVVDRECGFCATPTKGGNRFCSKACAARHMTKVRRVDPDKLCRAAAEAFVKLRDFYADATR